MTFSPVLPMAALLLSLAGPMARAQEKGILLNETGFKMSVAAVPEACGSDWFTLTGTDVTGSQTMGTEVKIFPAILQVMPTNTIASLGAEQGMQFQGDQDMGSNVTHTFKISGFKVAHRSPFSFKVLFTCNKAGKEVRSFLTQEGDPIGTLPFDVISSESAPHLLRLVPKAGGEGEAGAEPVSPEQIGLDMATQPDNKGCCVIL